MRSILIISTTYSQSQHIKALIARHAGQFQVLGTVDNSVLGMSLIESSRPDIVIMPVTMNFWNAEDLIHNLLPRGISPQFILLQDGDEPAPAGAAAAQVAALLPSLLPSEEPLLQALRDAARQCSRQRAQSAAQQPYNPAVQHSLEVMELLMGLTPPWIGAAQREFGRLRVGSEDCWMLLCAPQSGEAEPFNFFAQFASLESIFEPLHRLLASYGRSEVCVYRESNLCILLTGGQAEEPDWDSLCGALNRVLTSFGVPALRYFEISDVPLPLERWHSQCRELLQLRTKRFFFSPSYLQPKLVRAWQTPVSQAQILDQVSAVSLALQNQKQAGLLASLQELERMVSHSLSDDLYSFVTMQLILLHSRLRYSYGLQNGQDLRSLRFSSVAEAFRAFQNLFLDLYRELDALRGSANPIVTEACGYIREHLAEELTLEIVARHVHVSPAYLSRLFKRETGSPFNAYVSRRRVQRAAQLLETPYKITEIAGMAGFENAKYFSQVFRKYTGKTPQQYRQDLRREDSP